MNSKKMNNWAGIFLLLSVLAIIFELLSGNESDGGIYFCLVMATILNVASAIIKKLESFEATK